jgi:hypothetical protein
LTTILLCTLSVAEKKKYQITNSTVDGYEIFSRSESGASAIDKLRNKSRSVLPITQISQALRKTETEIEDMFKQDHSLRLDLRFEHDKNVPPKIFYVEDAPDPAVIQARRSLVSEDDTISPEEATDKAQIRATNVFALHSRLGASKVIYLDFTGHNITETGWNSDASPYILAPAFSTDSDGLTFSTSEQSIILEVWQRVAEDYAPFDVDVTTEYGGSEDFLIRSSATDQQYGIRVLISPISSAFCSGCSGLSYVGTFGSPGPLMRKHSKFSSDFVFFFSIDFSSSLAPFRKAGTSYNMALVFSNTLFNSAKFIADVASHESGHNFGLSHDGNSATASYAGQGTGAVGWAPIMGIGSFLSFPIFDAIFNAQAPLVSEIV